MKNGQNLTADQMQLMSMWEILADHRMLIDGLRRDIDGRNAMPAIQYIDPPVVRRSSTKAMKAMKAMKAKDPPLVRRSSMKAMKAMTAIKSNDPPVVRRSSMGAMKAMNTGSSIDTCAMTEDGAYIAVSEMTGVTPDAAKSAVEGIIGLAVTQLAQHGSFNVAGMLKLKLAVTNGRNTVRASPLKKFKQLVH